MYCENLYPRKGCYFRENLSTSYFSKYTLEVYPLYGNPMSILATAEMTCNYIIIV